MAVANDRIPWEAQIQINAPKTVCSTLDLYLQAGGGVKREHNGHAVEQLMCVCAKLVGGSKETWGQKPVMWFLNSSTPDGGREGE